MKKIFTLLVIITLCLGTHAQVNSWYDSAQVRIDTLRKGWFTLKILDNGGTGIQDSIKIIHRKHEFPWGTSIDLKYNAGNNYTAGQPVSAPADSEVYRTERWAKTLAYSFPAVKANSYKLTLKLSENYFSTANSRLFDVYIDGQRVMQNIDKFALAGGQYRAFDTTVNVTALGESIRLEFMASKDNAAVMAIVLSDDEGTPLLRLNCSGKDITTKNGNHYVSDLLYLDKSSPDDNWIKANMLKYCNYGVTGNQFKWSGIEPIHYQLNYAPFENTLSWFNKVGWDMRAHTLLWGGNNNTDYHCLPEWVIALSGNPKAMYDTCKMRVIREVSRYRGIVKEYDVINEPTHANYLQKIVGDSINWNCFKWAHDADPDARLFVNDYNIIEWQDQTNNFVALVKRMLDHGAPVSGIGAQCHIGANVDIPNFKARFDQLGQFGLPIKITEFDMGAKSLTDVQYATEISKMMRLAFSHPKIEGFIFWGITEPTWVPESIISLIKEDKTTRLAADSVYRLIHNVWSTKITGITDASGSIRFKGYFGDYDVLVKIGGIWKKFTASCLKAKMDSVIVLNETESIYPSPVLMKACIQTPTTIELTFDKPMADPSFEVRNFMIFDTITNGFQSATIKQGDPNTIILRSQSALLTNKSLIPVSYFPGNQTSADGGMLEALGPVYMKGYLSAYVSSQTSKDGKRIAIKFNRKLADTTINKPGFTVKVNNVNRLITQLALNATKDSMYLFLAERVVRTTDVVTVTYQMNKLQTEDGFYVKGFSKTVTNNIFVPSFVSANTNNSGKKIAVVFNGQLADTSIHITDFALKVNNINNPITHAVLGLTKDTVYLTVTNQIINSADIITISYHSGLLKSTDSLYVTGFTNKSVRNTVVMPNFISASTSMDGQTILVNFNRPLANPIGQESAFVITVNSLNDTVVSASLNNSNNQQIIITLRSVVYKDDTVVLNYDPGTLMSSYEIPVSAFSSDVTNNSTLISTGFENRNDIRTLVYPNPFTNEICIVNTNAFTQIMICDMAGKKIIQSSLIPGEKNIIQMSDFERGAYLIILSDQNRQYTRKLLKQ